MKTATANPTVKPTRSQGFTPKDKAPTPAPAAKVYTRDATSDTWKDSHGKAYRLDTHGQTPARLDLQPV